jgi:membrane-associated protease RseP (regulator of RpoE activity)
MQIWTDGDGEGKMTWFHTPTPPEPPDVNLEQLEGLQDKLVMLGVPGMRPRLGVTVDSVGKQLAEYFGVKQGAGVLVTSVGKGSAAESAGIKAGDVIVKVDDESVQDAGDLHNAMRERHGKALTLTIVRDRRESTIKVPAPPEEETPAPGTPSARRPGTRPAEVQREVERAMRDAQRAMHDGARTVHEATRLNSEQRQQIQEAIQKALEGIRGQGGSIGAAAEAYEDAVQDAIEDGTGGGQDQGLEEGDTPAAEDSDGGSTSVDSGHGTEEQRAEIRRAVEEARRIRLEGQESDR